MPYLKINPSVHRVKLLYNGLHPKSLLDGGPDHPSRSVENAGHFLLSGSLPEAIEICDFNCPIRKLSLAHEDIS